MSDTLIARLEAAPCGSRELSDEVLVALGWIYTPPDKDDPDVDLAHDGWESPGGGSCWTRPDCTRSVDDALALVPEGWMLEITWRRDDGWVDVAMDEDRNTLARLHAGKRGRRRAARHVEAKGRTKDPATIVCAAILRAREASDGQD